VADGSGVFDTASAIPLSVIGFAGGGGSSVGLYKATGRAPSMAANHWLTAVLTHQAHFPDTEHYCADIFDVSPQDWRPHAPIRLGWFSPDCTHHSKARGSAPKSERIRGLSWSVIPWAKARRIQTIFVENVEEIVTWCPLYRCEDDWRAAGVRGEVGQPIVALKGVTFRLWRRRFNQAGYWFEYRPKLNAADHGGGQTRVRFYAIAEYVGVERVTKIALGLEPSPIRWPEPTHARRDKAEALKRRPWTGFCEFADWSQPCPSIYLTPDEVEQLRRETGRRVQRPLVKATHRRIMRGVDRYLLSAKDPYRVPAALVPIDNRGWGGDRAHDVRDPLNTLTASRGGQFAMVTPSLLPVNHGGDARVYDPTDPLRTVTAVAGGEVAVAAPFLVPRYGEREGQAPRCRDVREVLPTAVPTGNGASVVAASLHQLNTRDVGAEVADPLRTLSGREHQAVQSAFLVRQFGSAVGGKDIRAPIGAATSGGGRGGGHDQFVAAYLAQGNFGMLGRGCCEPVTTLTGRGTQQQVVAAHLSQLTHCEGPQFHDARGPIPTIMASGRGHQVVTAHLDTYYGSGSVGSDAGEPMRTATGKARSSLIMAWLEQANTGMVGHDAREPLSTIIAGGKSGWGGATQRLIEARLELDGGPIGRRAQVLASLWEHFGVPTPEEWADPTGTLDARRKFGLVILDGAVWMIVDIGLRMLTVGEMAAASGLPSWVDLSRDVHGSPVSKTHQTQMIGNMVHPDPCAALIATQCPDLILPGWTPEQFQQPPGSQEREAA